MRDDKWLFAKLDEIWDNHFPDVPQDNDVKIIWGRRARNRLGSIKQSSISNFQFSKNIKSKNKNYKKDHPVTVITINSLFKDLKIPEFVVISTIAHELTHYAHGFNSPLEQKFETPHAGGIIDKEMDSRGLREVRLEAKKWLKEHWKNYILKNFPPKARRAKRRKIIIWR